MKVLSLKEPYATLIKKGIKTIETRSWKTKYRGKLYIHASRTKIPKEFKENKPLMDLLGASATSEGYIICSCTLKDVIKMTPEYIQNIKENDYQNYLCGVYAPGRYAWILDDITPIKKPILAKGKLGIWEFEKSNALSKSLEESEVILKELEEGKRKGYTDIDSLFESLDK